MSVVKKNHELRSSDNGQYLIISEILLCCCEHSLTKVYDCFCVTKHLQIIHSFNYIRPIILNYRHPQNYIFEFLYTSGNFHILISLVNF